MYTTCSQHILSLLFSCSMNNLSSYCGLVDAKIRASDKDLPVWGWRKGRINQGFKKPIIWAISLCTHKLQNLEMHKMGFTKLLCNNIVWQIVDVCKRNNNKKYSRPKTSFLIENVEIERQTSRQSVAQSLEQIRSHKKGLKVYEVASLQVLKRSSKKYAS